MSDNSGWENMFLESKEDLPIVMRRINAWFTQNIIDRAPVRFTSNNKVYKESKTDENVGNGKRWETYKDKWFDSEYRVGSYLDSIKNTSLLGDTLPIFFADFSPNFYPALFGTRVEFDETTAWVTEHIVKDYDSLKELKPDTNSIIFKKAKELVIYALDKSKDKFLVGLPDIYCGMDTIDALRGTQDILLDMMTNPDGVTELIKIITDKFFGIYDYFADLCLINKQPTCNWMGIPAAGKFYVPACDLGAMFSTDFFIKFALESLKRVIGHMNRVVFHLDGKEVARHIDYILDIPGVDAIQWVQGMGTDRPIMQWVPLIKKILNKGKSIVVDVDKEDLESFIDEFEKPDGIFLFVESDVQEEQKDIIKRINKW